MWFTQSWVQFSSYSVRSASRFSPLSLFSSSCRGSGFLVGVAAPGCTGLSSFRVHCNHLSIPWYKNAVLHKSSLILSKYSPNHLPFRKHISCISLPFDLWPSQLNFSTLVQSSLSSPLSPDHSLSMIISRVSDSSSTDVPWWCNTLR